MHDVCRQAYKRRREEEQLPLAEKAPRLSPAQLVSAEALDTAEQSSRQAEATAWGPAQAHTHDTVARQWQGKLAVKSHKGNEYVCGLVAHDQVALGLATDLLVVDYQYKDQAQLDGSRCLLFLANAADEAPKLEGFLKYLAGYRGLAAQATSAEKIACVESSRQSSVLLGLARAGQTDPSQGLMCWLSTKA